ncbi:methyltransferase domain-containing protein [Horticoccus sp. 23ND18S-11]|uniref:methyltransferase domain-containing protein n=1 Tax=Horticoccus sp. 23ND18S-11 TaxID=3391832 RepID=UPI0039C987BC
MALHSLQSLSVRGFALVRRLWARLGDWIHARPRLAAWFYPGDAETSDLRYRDYNGRYFASFREQERMLADKPRMTFYHTAISRHIQPGDRVIDLGTGTGILGALAARRGAATVYAIDHSPILEHARTLAEANRVKNLEFVATHSKEFTLDQPVDVILHEQMGDCLFDESMVANVSDLRDRLLKPGGLILPSRFEFYCEPIMIKDDRLVPFLWELNVHGYDYSSLERHRPQEPDYYHLCSSDLNLVDHFLGEPSPALAIDLHTVTEANLPREVAFERKVVNPGRLDGYAIYFKARVDTDLCLGTGPLDRGRAPHWGFRILRTEAITFARGDVIDIRLSVGHWPDVDTWRWSQQKRSPLAGDPPTRPQPAGLV